LGGGRSQSRLKDFTKTLSPVNTTPNRASIDLETASSKVLNKNYNLSDPTIKLETIIDQKILSIKEHQDFYKNIFKVGHFIHGMKQPNYINDKKNGEIQLADVRKVPVQGKWQDMVLQSRKVNWLDLLATVKKNKNYKIKKAWEFDYNGVTKSTDVKLSPLKSIEYTKQRLVYIRLMKRINQFYNFDRIDRMKIPQERKDIIKRSMLESLNSLGMYFTKTKSGEILTIHFNSSEQLPNEIYMEGETRIIYRGQLSEEAINITI